MKTIKFTCHSNNAPAYSCSEPGDNSGEYVPVEEVVEFRKVDDTKAYNDLVFMVAKIDKKAASYMATRARELDGFHEVGRLVACFGWSGTKQGHSYWSDIQSKLLRGAK